MFLGVCVALLDCLVVCCLFACLHVSVLVRWAACLFVCLFVRVFACLFVRVFVCGCV